MSEVGAAKAGGVGAGQLRAVAEALGGAGGDAVGMGEGSVGGAISGGAISDMAVQRVHNGRETAGGRARLGEELPIFCERCGYALHGLPQARCERCAILHFACPECGHHQPINTLRPAAQRVLGRIRAFVLGLWVFFKINFFGWLLFAWFGMGVEWSYEFHSYRNGSNPNSWNYQLLPRPVDLPAFMGFTLFSLAFGMFGRMLLLRWRRGWAVGAVLGALVLMASYTGAKFREHVDFRGPAVVMPVGADFQMLLIYTALMLVFAAVIVWPIWLALVHLFLPDRTARALLDWQRSMSSAAPALARQE
jgi:hypothetical protein